MRRIEIEVPDGMAKLFEGKRLSDKECVMLLYPELYDRKMDVEDLAKVAGVSRERLADILVDYRMDKLRRRESEALTRQQMLDIIGNAKTLKVSGNVQH